jgi:predicted patatin/cPLA2 family phospholipase
MLSIYSFGSFYYKLFLFGSLIVASLSVLLYSDNLSKLSNLSNLSSIPLKTFDRTCNVLSFSGGGSFGAVEIGILKNIYLPEYDIITGVSAGALNAGLLSYYNSKHNNSILKGINVLIDLYSSMRNPDVYEKSIFDFPKYWSYYSTKPFRKTLTNIISNKSYVSGTKDKITLIGSTNLNLGYLETFDFDTFDKTNQVEILMSSTAIPILFPPNQMNGSTYVDGGLISNQILIGLKQKIQCKTYNITYISSGEKLNQITNIDSFGSFTKRLIKVFKSSFDDQMDILQGLNCKFPSGKIYYYYPLDKMLEQYSILDMDHGAELIDIGSKYHKVEVFDYCI